MVGKSDAVVARRRELKHELVETMADVAIRCKNGGRTLNEEEALDIAGVSAALYLRARDNDAALQDLMKSGKGCRNRPADTEIEAKNLWEVLVWVNNGAKPCGQGTACDLGKWARNIVVSNPKNADLQNLWKTGRYAERLAEATRLGENEVAEYKKRPVGREPTNFDEALAQLIYYSAEMPEDLWENMREGQMDNFDARGKRDKEDGSMWRLWKENLGKFTYKKALSSCVKDYPARAQMANTRLAALK